MSKNRVTDYLNEVVRPAARDAAERARERLGEATATASERLEEAKTSLSQYIDEYTERLQRLFSDRMDPDRQALERGLPPFALREVRGSTSLDPALLDDPLAAYIPEEYGGRGAHMHESLAVLEATGYESLPLCLMVGINGGLFLQPVAKYGDAALKPEVFRRFLGGKSMGGLMITEPDHGTDALHMQTVADQLPNGDYHLQGTKHWAGLTGWADYWLLTARPRAKNGSLGRDVGFFVCDVTQPGQHIEVEEIYANLGLYMIPYGRNKIDVRIPAVQRLEPHTTGIKMMLDLLHRSRLQFPGMAMGFLRRMRDEAFIHTQERTVGPQKLVEYDQVQARLARLQASATACAAMCTYTAEHAGIEYDVSGLSLPANAFKTVVTDLMQEAAQSLLQMTGAKGYRQDHLAGRSLTDTRPFQIFEGSNDVLYQQVAEAVLKSMRKAKETNLYRYLRTDPLTARAADFFSELLAFDVDLSLLQRKLVQLGQALGRVIVMEMIIELGERGYRADLVEQALDSFRAEVEGLVAHFRAPYTPGVILDHKTDEGWLQYVRTEPALVTA